MSTIIDENTPLKSRWNMLAMIALTGCVFVAMPQMCMPVLFKEISTDLGLDLVQVGVIWGMIPLSGMFVILFGGYLSDRFGTKKVLIVGCFLTGLSGILRGMSDSFVTLSATMFLFGLLQIITSPALIRASTIWFPGKHLGLANGVLSMSMGLGFLLSSMISATILSPLLGGWRNVLIAYGIASIVISILWYFTRNDPQHEDTVVENVVSLPFKETLLNVIKIKRIWILGSVVMWQIGCVQVMLGYLPIYLRDMGWNAATADGAMATFHGLSTLFTVPIVLLSGKLGSRKIMLFVTTLMTAVGVGILALGSGSNVWIAMVVAGIVRDGFMALQMTMLLETREIGTRYAGTAIGLIHTISRVGEIVSPPVGNSFADINPSIPFVFWAGMAVIALFGFTILKDTKRS
ncbi:MAG: MFS transporter [Dehalococcoidales bacterium]|nr:MAG: MFS transporter [Dehalococcoidales bacterium]